ncbi:MAG: ABC transporter permease [Lachnospiraceae bacterium]|nr:ABC transporter permease [Lachnospiraceae bacterium]
MLKYIFKRIVLAIVSMFIVMTVLFVLLRLIPNPVELGVNNEGKALIEMRRAWGYYDPIPTQYAIFLKNLFTKFDWGFCTTVGTFLTPVTEYVASKFPFTIYINVFAALISVPLGLFFGIIAAVYKNKWPDQIINVFIMVFISVPSFVYAFVMQYYMGFKWGLCPLVLESGTDFFSWHMFRSAIMPIMSLSFHPIAFYMRYVRAELTETLTTDYMLLARTKGLTRAQASFRHAFRNSLIPIFPTILAEIIAVFSGAIITEQVFAIPGIGRTYLMALNLKDYSVFLCLSMFYVVIGFLGGIVFDMSYMLIDPRIRMGGGKTNEY